MKIFLISLLISIQAFAEPVLLPKNSPSPYEGYLFTTEETIKLRNELIDKDTLTELNKSLNKSIDLYKSNESLYIQQKQLLIDQNDKLAKSLYQERQVTNWERVGFFVLGVAVTGLAVYGASQLAK